MGPLKLLCLLSFACIYFLYFYLIYLFDDFIFIGVIVIFAADCTLDCGTACSEDKQQYCNVTDGCFWCGYYGFPTVLYKYFQFFLNFSPRKKERKKVRKYINIIYHLGVYQQMDYRAVTFSSRQ